MGRQRGGAPSFGVSAREYARGIAGGLLFSLPLLYTAEMWSAGFQTSAARMLAALAVTFILLLGYNRYAGLRRDTTRTEIVIDSIEELGIGLAAAAVTLWLLGQLTAAMHPLEIAGRVVVLGLVAAIGVSIGTAQLGAADTRDQGTEMRQGTEWWSPVVLAACGGTIVAANVAPTEEIEVLGATLDSLALLLLMLISMTVAAGVLHFSEFRGSTPRGETGAAGILRSTVVTYAVALAVAASLLWFFHRFDGATAAFMAAQTVVLAFPASIGASAGRLLLQASR